MFNILGIPINFRVPEGTIQGAECDSESATISVSAEPSSTSKQAPLNNETICQLLQELQEGSQSPEGSTRVQGGSQSPEGSGQSPEAPTRVQGGGQSPRSPTRVQEADSTHDFYS